MAKDFTDLTHDECAECLNDTFTITHEGTDHEVQLIEAKDLGSGADGGRAPFSLLFRGPEGMDLPQASYQVAHDKLGGGEIFLVPLGPGKEGMLYEAVFN